MGIKESIEKAFDSSGLLLGEIREGYNAALNAKQMALALLLFDLIEPTAKIEQRLRLIETIAKESA